MKGEMGCLAILCELGIFGQEAVPWVNGLCASPLRYLQDLITAEIRFGARSRADPISLIGERDEHRVLVGIGVHTHGLDSHLLGSLDDPACNLSYRDRDVNRTMLSQHANWLAGSMGAGR